MQKIPDSCNQKTDSRKHITYYKSFLTHIQLRFIIATALEITPIPSNTIPFSSLRFPIRLNTTTATPIASVIA